MGSAYKTSTPVLSAKDFARGEIFKLSESFALIGSFFLSGFESSTVLVSLFSCDSGLLSCAPSGVNPEISSPSSPITHIFKRHGTSSPSSKYVSKRTPSTFDSSSKVALSVSYVNNMSPTLTLSPFFLCHLETTHDSTVFPCLGIITAVAIFYPPFLMHSKELLMLLDSNMFMLFMQYKFTLFFVIYPCLLTYPKLFH